MLEIILEKYLNRAYKLDPLEKKPGSTPRWDTIHVYCKQIIKLIYHFDIYLENPCSYFETTSTDIILKR